MKKMTLALSAAILLGSASQVQAQVSDVNFVIAPTAGYTVWNKKLNLGDAPFYGVRAGFAFGPLLEIRGTYERSFDLKGKLKGSRWGLFNDLADKLEDSNVRIQRYGGDVKLNLWSNAVLTPYLSGGAGVIKFSYDELSGTSSAGTDITAPAAKTEQLYANLAAGLKINFSPRVALSLEARDLIFNAGAGNRYLADPLTDSKTLHNFGGQASLDIYLSGNSYDRDDKVTQAYRRAFSDGFRGLKFVLEPGVAYLNFRGNSRFRDTWMLGGSAGVDLNSMVGIRGFYYRETKEADKLSYKFGKNLEMFGGNFIARLNVVRGVTPYLTLGAGYLKVDSDKYEDINGATGVVKSGLFGIGGAGVELPLHHSVALYGSANAMILKDENPSVSTVMAPSEVNVNWMFQAGVRFNIGARSRSGVDAYKSYAAAQVASERSLRLDEINKLRADYDARIDELNQQIAEATAEQDAAKVAMLTTERNRVETTRLERVVKSKAPQTVVMTESQLERIIARVLAATGTTQATTAQQTDLGKLSDLDKILLISALRNGQLAPAQLLQLSPLYGNALAPQAVTQLTPEKLDDSTVDKLVARIKELEARLANQSVAGPLVEGQTKVTVIPTTQTAAPQVAGTTAQATAPQAMVLSVDESTGKQTLTTINNDGTASTKEVKEESFLKFNQVNPYVGFGFGDASTFNVGVRGLWQMGNSRFDLAPEAYVALGSGTGYGLGANIVYNFGALKTVALVPYVGLGLGYSHIGGVNRFGLTGLVGVGLENVLGGRLFVDYSLRPAFKNHHFSVGYTF